MGKKREMVRSGRQAVTEAIPLDDPEELKDLLRRNQEVVEAKGTSLYAIDVLGEDLWSRSESISYFSRQVDPYLSKNLRGQSPTLVASRTLTSAISRARQNGKAKSRGMLAKEALSHFHNQESVTVGKVEYEIARILIWPEFMLCVSIADTIISCHEAVRVPLFFMDVSDPVVGFGKWRDPRVDYCMKCRGQHLVLGFFGYNDVPGMHDQRGKERPPDTLYGYDGKKPRYESILQEFRGLLSNSKLLFAKDAQALARFKNRGNQADSTLPGERRSGRLPRLESENAPEPARPDPVAEADRLAADRSWETAQELESAVNQSIRRGDFDLDTFDGKQSFVDQIRKLTRNYALVVLCEKPDCERAATFELQKPEDGTTSSGAVQYRHIFDRRKHCGQTTIDRVRFAPRSALDESGMVVRPAGAAVSRSAETG